MKNITCCGLVTACLIITFETLFLLFTEPLTGIPILQPNGDDAVVVVKRNIMKKSDGSVVLIGDSSCMMGIIPKIVTKTINTECVNLGIFSSFTLAGCESLLKETLEKYHPKAIVLAILPASLVLTHKDAEKFGVLGRYLIAYRQSIPSYSPSLDDWESWFFSKHHFNIFPPQFGGSFRQFCKTVEKEKGFYREPRTYNGFGRPKRQHLQPSTFSENAILQMARTASSYGTKIVLWWSPTPDDSICESYLKDARDFIGKIKKYSPQLLLLQDTPPAWFPEHFGAVNHVNFQGAMENSAELASALKEIL